MFIADVDHWPLPAEIAPTDLAAQAEHVAARFAEIEPSFENATLIAQASNSAGQSTVEFSLKLWGWLREPTTTEDLRGWTHAMNTGLGPTALGKAALDIKQARAVQPIYHHTPRFIAMADPMQGKRWRYLHRAGGEIELKLARGAAASAAPRSARPRIAAIENAQPRVAASARPRVATGLGKERWKAKMRAELGVSGCYGAIHTAVYAAVAAGANDEEIVAEIRAAADDGRKFPSWSPAYVKEKTSPFFLRPMIADARAREAERTRRIASGHRRAASASRARGAKREPERHESKDTLKGANTMRTRQTPSRTIRAFWRGSWTRQRSARSSPPKRRRKARRSSARSRASSAAFPRGSPSNWCISWRP